MKCSSIYMAKKLRTLIITEFVETEQLIKIFNQLKCIRTLSLRYIKGIEKLPSDVKRLLHLRFLDLSGIRLVELPDIICHLNNLHTLKLNYCRKLVKLPDGIGNLLNLRHLELKATNSLSCLPQGIGRLRFLRSLEKFIVGDASRGCNIRELKDLSNLQGSLQIIGLEQVADVSDAAQAELKNKPVDELSLKFESFEEGESETMGGVLENLQPHENVEKLSIHGFGGSRFPCWIPNTSMSASLLRLTLIKCFNTTELPALGNLASLEKLQIVGMRSVKHIGDEFYGHGVAFPKLKKLKIDDMEELVEMELPVSIGGTIMPDLQKLFLSNCPRLKALPPGLAKLESLEKLKLKKLSQVKHIGQEFYGFDDSDNSNLDERAVAFPQLKVLQKCGLNELVEWEVPRAKDNKIMPCLCELELCRCPMLRALPYLGRLESLESLDIGELPCIKQVGFEFWGICGDEFGEEVKGSGEGEELVTPNLTTTTSSSSSFCKPLLLFPKLTQLTVRHLVEWDSPPNFQKDRPIVIMPRLRRLSIIFCPKLRGFPNTSLPCLHCLTLRECPNLHVIPHDLLPLLDSLMIWGDVDVFSESIPISEAHNNNYLNLTSPVIYSSKHPSLPKGFFSHLITI